MTANEENIQLTKSVSDSCFEITNLGVDDDPTELLSSIPGVLLIEKVSNKQYLVFCNDVGQVRSDYLNKRTERMNNEIRV